MAKLPAYLLLLLLTLSGARGICGHKEIPGGPAASRAEARSVRLSLDAKDGLKLDGKKVELEALKGEITKIARKPGKLEVRLSADDHCPFLFFHQVMKTLHDARISNIVLEGMGPEPKKSE